MTRLFLVGLVLLSLLGCQRGSGLEELGSTGDFRLTDRSGKTITQDDLRGKVWIASFVFVRCTSHCPQISGAVRELQTQLKEIPNLRFVTFTVDPAHDREAELKEYAEKFQADPERWLFLTGGDEEINRLLVKQFKVGQATGNKPEEMMHSIKLVLVDTQGKIRGYFDGMAPQAMVELEGRDAAEKYLTEERQRLVLATRSLAHTGVDFPFFHACLNCLATVLLLVGGLAVKFRAIRLHIICMVTTLGISALFLASYLNYHLLIKGSVATRFQDQNPGSPESVRYLYYAILLSHTILAVVVTPLAVWTAYLGWKGDLTRHRPLAKWVLPTWLYVTSTGVVVYWMLYRMYAPN